MCPCSDIETLPIDTYASAIWEAVGCYSHHQSTTDIPITYVDAVVCPRQVNGNNGAALVLVHVSSNRGVRCEREVV